MALNKYVEEMANAAKAAQNQQSSGDSSLLQYMRQLNAQRTPARSNSEAIGRGIREFILPLIMQGVQQWKANYDERGAKKDRADDLYKRIMAGETLSPQDVAFFNEMQKKYPDRYGGGQGGQPQQPAAPAPQGTLQQGTPQQPPTLQQAIAQYAKMPNPDWQAQEAQAREQALTDANGAAFSGTDYGAKWGQDAQAAMQNLKQALGGNDENDLLKWLKGRWQ